MISTSLRPSSVSTTYKVTSNPTKQIQFGNGSQSKNAEGQSQETRHSSENRLSSLFRRYHLNPHHSYPQKDIDHVLKLAQREGNFQGTRSTLLQAALQQLSGEITQKSGQFTDESYQVRKLEQQAEQIIGELARRQQFQLLSQNLTDENFRYYILSALLQHNTPKNNYRLSQTVKLPESLSDSSEMEFRTHNRTLPMYENLFRLQTEQLEGQKILLVGGGKSPIKTGLEQAKVNAHVTNIDKFFPNHNPHNEDHKIGKDFYNPEVNQHLQPNTYDEIWAYYSLPQYADTKEEVKALYQKSIGALRTGGTLRVFPTKLEVKPDHLPETEQASSYPAHLWLGLNDTQTLSRPYLFQQSEKVINLLKKRPDLFQLEEMTAPPEGKTIDNLTGDPNNKSVRANYSRHTTGANITLLGTPEEAQAYLNQESFTKKLQRLFTFA